jgi:hypothetical protein
VRGAKKWLDTTEVQSSETGFVQTNDHRQKMFENSFYSLEKKIDDERFAAAVLPQIEKIKEL